MNPLYNAGIHCLSLGARLASLKSGKITRMLNGQRATASTLAQRRAEVAPEGFDIWFHVASLGEFEQARPMIERIRAKQPDKKILLSFFSPSGYEVRCNYDKVDAVCYLPFDTPRRVRKFLADAAPKMAIFVKYEFWGNYLSALKQAGIPVYIISAIFRPGQRFFKPWGTMFRKMLSCYEHLFVQDEASKKLLAGIGLDNVTAAGDTRFDRVSDIVAHAKDVDEVAAMTASSPFTLIAGSSWPADEELYIPWLHSHPDVKAVIAPHEFDARRIEALADRLGREHTVILSELRAKGTTPHDARYIIIDCFGLLSSIYRYGDVAVIGGGFGTGIHNLNEAAVYDMPVIFGPNHHKFKEAADLLSCGGGFSYDSAEGFGRVIEPLYKSKTNLDKAGKAAGDYIRHSLGATDKIYKFIFNDHD
ncbi:MAG: 3-deoxy-D-manno-octulosonic acid transferase [Muribaculaceae bacterium]